MIQISQILQCSALQSYWLVGQIFAQSNIKYNSSYSLILYSCNLCPAVRTLEPLWQSSHPPSSCKLISVPIFYFFIRYLLNPLLALPIHHILIEAELSEKGTSYPSTPLPSKFPYDRTALPSIFRFNLWEIIKPKFLKLK